MMHSSCQYYFKPRSSPAGLASQPQLRVCCSNTPHSRKLACESSANRATTTSTSSTAAVSDTRTATVHVDVGYAQEQAVVQLQHPDSRLVAASMAFPLGLVLESVEGQVVVTEVNEASAAAEAGCRVGDVVRATTAFTMQMTYPAANLLFGGVGRPKLVKMLLPTDKVSFSKVMDAVRSNNPGQGGDGRITLVLERNGSSDDGGSSSSNGSSTGRAAANGDGSDGAAASTPAAGAQQHGVNAAGSHEGAIEQGQGQAGEEGDGVFDPQIFE